LYAVETLPVGSLVPWSERSRIAPVWTCLQSLATLGTVTVHSGNGNGAQRQWERCANAAQQAPQLLSVVVVW